MKLSGHHHLGVVCETRSVGKGKKSKVVEIGVKIDGRIERVAPDQIERTTR